MTRQVLEKPLAVQKARELPLSMAVAESKAAPGAPNLDIEMETGIGKTYVFIKTIMELTRRSSVEIRGGVKKSFDVNAELFRQAHYTKPRTRRSESDRAPLSTAIDIPSLYTALLTPLVPVAAQAGENVAAIAGRVEAARKLDREISALERKLRDEPQLNRKVELRRTIESKQAKLAALASTTRRGPVWTS